MKNETFNDEVGYLAWGGGRLRSMMHCIYILSFLCLLRFDEVLKIQLHHIKIENAETCEISLHLVFRKTKQEGGKNRVYSLVLITLITYLGIKPFHLHPNPN